MNFLTSKCSTNGWFLGKIDSNCEDIYVQNFEGQSAGRFTNDYTLHRG